MAELLLRWEKFGLCRGLHSMLGSGELIDVTLACQGEILQAHKTVLAACSPHFKHIFMVNPSQHPVVIMQDVQLPHLKALLNFMYTGEATVAQQELPRFLKTAEALKVSGLAATDDQQDSEDSDQSEKVSATKTSEPPAAKPRAPSPSTSSSQPPPCKRPRCSRSDTNWSTPPPPMPPDWSAPRPPSPSFPPEVVAVPAPELTAVKLEYEEGLQGEEAWPSLNQSSNETTQTAPFLYVPLADVHPSTSGMATLSTAAANEGHFVMENESDPVFVPPSSQQQPGSEEGSILKSYQNHVQTINPDDNVEITRGSGVYIKRIKHLIACDRYNKSPAVMARYLLRQILGDDYLMTHSALGKGQKSAAADQNVLVSVDRTDVGFAQVLRSSQQEADGNNTENVVELILGSGVYIQKCKLLCACNRYKENPSNLARHLLRELLGDEYIMTHSAKGQRYSPAADRNILDSVDLFVRTKFHEKADEIPDIVSLFNNLTCYIKKHLRRKNGVYRTRQAAREAQNVPNASLSDTVAEPNLAAVAASSVSTQAPAEGESSRQVKRSNVNS